MKETCPVCGQKSASLIWVGAYRMCRLCVNNYDKASKILNHKHRERLDKILDELNKEV